MKVSAIVFAAAFFALSQAAPSSKNGLKCKPSGKTGKIIGHNGGAKHRDMYEFNFKAGSTGPKVLRASDDATQEFEFYTCEAPSDKFAGAALGASYGQLRSKDDKNMCVTSGTSVTKNEDGLVSITSHNDGRVTLEKCSSDEETARRQWFSVSQGVPTCPPLLSQMGFKNDVTQSYIGQNNDHTAHFEANLFYNMDEHIYLADKVPNGCK